MTAGAESDLPFVGRSETAEALYRRFEDARAGRGGVTLLVGETGVGKSTLVRDFVGRVRSRGIPTIVGKALAADDPPPFSLIRSTFASIRDDPTLSAAAAGAPVGGDSVLLGFAPRLGEEAPPDLTGIERRLLDSLEGMESRTARSHDQVLDVIAQQFLALTHRGPTVLVLEDLHRADASSLSAVEFLADRLRDEPFWVLATSRPYATLAQAGRARLERFETATRAQQIVLRPMTSGEVSQFLHLQEPSREFSHDEVMRRYSETGGNPLLLEQRARHREAAGPATAPSTTGLLSLDKHEQRVLEIASVLGPEFNFAYLFRASGEEDEERFTELVEELVHRGALVERPGEVLAFPGDRLREEVYGRISESQRQLLHWSAGETLEGMSSGGIAGIYALARHFYLGRAGAKSVKYNRQAAEIADNAFAPDVARDHLVRALESQRAVRPENLEAEAELTIELARVTEWLGHLPESERVLREFLSRERENARLPAAVRANVELFLARVLTSQGALPEASELAQKVLSTPGLEGQPLVLLGAHHQAGMVLYYTGRYAEALTHHDEEIRLARLVGNPLVIIHSRVWRIASLAMMGPTEAAIAEAREVTAERDRLGSERESGQAHLFFGDLLADARAPPALRKEAIGEYAKTIYFSERARDPRRVGWATYKTAELLCEDGRLDDATEKANGACEIFREIGDQVGLSMATKVLGQVEMARGTWEAAESHFAASAQLLQGLSHELEEIDVVLRRAELARLRGDRNGAEKLLTELESKNLSRARPDLVPEFEKLRADLGRGEGGSASS